ncbi:glucose import [Tritrichomonas musculus]|uniref:Glucose import n=1 Tax=Tritrichomonas musculus TaxID=1915356 RepID=A0ABR2J2R3_9EUKA
MGICSISLLYALVICLGSIVNGDVGVYTSPTGQKIREIHHLTDTDFRWSFYGSIAFLAAAVGPFATKFLFYLFKGKRKNTMFVIAVFSLFSWLLNCVTKVNIYGGWVARALLGVSIGMYSSICALYLVELSPDGYSGFYGSLNQIAIFFGQAIFSFLGPFMDYMELNYLAAAVSLVLSISIWFIPESPVVKLNGNLVGEVKHSIFQKKYVKGIIIGICVMFLQQFSGINGIVANLADIFRNAGLELNPNYQSGISILSLFISSFIGSAMVDKCGRKFVWLLSSSFSFVGCFIMALNEKFEWSNILPLVCIFVYNFGFGLGLGPIPWFIVLELFDDEVREAGNTICVVFNWIFAFVIVMSFPEMKKSMGMFGVMIFFSVVCILAILFGLIIIKDNRKELTENEQDYIDEKSDSD